MTNPLCIALSLSILSVLFELVCENVSPGAWKACRVWSGRATVFGFARLTCAGRFVLILYDLVERVPEVCNGFVFRGHSKDLLDLAVENVRQGEEFFETLGFPKRQQNELADAANPRTKANDISDWTYRRYF